MTERHHGWPAPFHKQTGILMFMASVAVNLEQVWGEIRRVALNCGRNSDEIQLMAVSKTFSAEQVKKARAAGQRLFGENRIQEAGEKIPQLADPDLEWHLIGPLQSNKAARAVQLFNVIQTLDSTKIADKVNHFAVKFGITSRRMTRSGEPATTTCPSFLAVASVSFQSFSQFLFCANVGPAKNIRIKMIAIFISDLLLAQ